MRNIFSKIAIILFIATLTACKSKNPVGPNGVVYKSPTEYNDYIVSRQTNLMRKVMKFAEASQKNLDSAEVVLSESINDVRNMIKDISGMPPYRGDSAFRNAAIASFKFYEKAFDKDYRRLIELRKNPGNDLMATQQEMNKIVADITNEEKKYDEAFQKAQQDFAQKNNMKLVENQIYKEFQEKMKNN